MSAHPASLTKTHDPGTSGDLLAAIRALRADLHRLRERLDRHDAALRELVRPRSGGISVQEAVNASFDRLESATLEALAQRNEPLWRRILRGGRS